MNDDWMKLKHELDRLEGRILDFGSFFGWRVEQVCNVNRGYLFWCLEAAPLRHELRKTILRVLADSSARPRPRRPSVSRISGSLARSIPRSSRQAESDGRRVLDSTS